MWSAVERRRSVRECAVENEASLKFGAVAQARRVSARVVNIGRNGALILVPEELAPCEPLLLRLERPVKTDWVEVMVVRVGRLHHVGIMFREPIRDDIRLAAVLGLDFGWIVKQEDSSSSD